MEHAGDRVFSGEADYASDTDMMSKWLGKNLLSFTLSKPLNPSALPKT